MVCIPVTLSVYPRMHARTSRIRYSSCGSPQTRARARSMRSSSAPNLACCCNRSMSPCIHRDGRSRGRQRLGELIEQFSSLSIGAAVIGMIAVVQQAESLWTPHLGHLLLLQQELGRMLAAITTSRCRHRCIGGLGVTAQCRRQGAQFTAHVGVAGLLFPIPAQAEQKRPTPGPTPGVRQAATRNVSGDCSCGIQHHPAETAGPDSLELPLPLGHGAVALHHRAHQAVPHRHRHRPLSVIAHPQHVGAVHPACTQGRYRRYMRHDTEEHSSSTQQQAAMGMCESMVPCIAGSLCS